MDIKRIGVSILVLIMVLVIGAGVYFILNPGGVAQTPSTTTNTTGGTDNGSVPNIPTHTQNADGNPDIDTALTGLFKSISATPIVFTPVASTDGDLGSVYTLYTGDIAVVQKMFPKLTSFPINISLVDLNKDGSPEAVVWENLPGVCGTSGCPLEIYRKVKGKWSMFFSGFSGPTVGMSASYTKGYTDLFLPTLGDVGYQSKITLFAYDGLQYVPNKVVATWNGNQFTQ